MVQIISGWQEKDHPLLIKSFAALQNKSLCPFFRDEKATCLLIDLFKELAPKHPKLIISIASLCDEEGYIPFGYQDMFLIIKPWLSKLVNTNLKLLKDFLLIRNKQGTLDVFARDIFPDIFPLLQEIGDRVPQEIGERHKRDEHELVLLEIFSSYYDKKGCPIFAYRGFIEIMMPWLKGLVTKNPKLLLKFMSIYTKGDESVISYNVDPADPEPFLVLFLEELITPAPELLKDLLTIPCRKRIRDDGKGIFAAEKLIHFIPLLKKIGAQNGKLLVEILSIQKDARGDLALFHSAVFKVLFPWFKELAQENPDLLVKIFSISNSGGFCVFRVPAIQCIIQQWLNALKGTNPLLFQRLSEIQVPPQSHESFLTES